MSSNLEAITKELNSSIADLASKIDMLGSRLKPFRRELPQTQRDWIGPITTDAPALTRIANSVTCITILNRHLDDIINELVL